MHKVKLITALLLISACSYAQYYYNQFAYLDGVNDYFAAAPHSELNPDTIAFTIEGWIFTQDTTGFNKTIISNVNSANSTGYAVMLQGSAANPGHAGKLQLNLNGVGNVFTQTAGTRVALNGWSHFCMTFINGAPLSDTIRFYINGSLIQTFTSVMPPPSPGNDSLRIGNCYLPGNYSNGFKGCVDDMRIFRAIKSAAVIANDRGIPLSFDQITNINLLNGTRYTGLNAAWTFNGNGNDKVGVNNNLKNNNGAAFINNSFNPENYRNQSNYYLRFPGNGWLTSADASNSSFDADTACTIEAWIYLDANRTTPQTIICKGTAAYNYILAVGSTPSNAPIFILNSGAKFLQGTKQILPKVWTHIAATYRSSGDMRLYINGVLDTFRTVSAGNINVNDDSVYIGRSLFGEYMYGNIDEVRISKFAKSSVQITAFMNTNLDNQNYTNTAFPQASYSFEGNTLDGINNNNFFIPKSGVFFERLNNISGAGGAAQAPLIRTSLNDAGLMGNSFAVSNKLIKIVNGTTVRDSILINNLSGSYRLNAALMLNHTYMNDLTITLRSPSGISVNLTGSMGSSLNDLMTVFDEQADSIINTNYAPFSMKVRPQNPLTSLMSGNLNGYWRISITDASANVDSGKVHQWGLKFIPITGISSNKLPDEFRLYQNYPNPFNPATVLSYAIPVGIHADKVKLNVYNSLGQHITTLVNQQLSPGTYEIKFDGTSVNGGLPSGIYYYRLEIHSDKLNRVTHSETKKMILLK